MNYVCAGEPSGVSWASQINAESGREGRTWMGLQKHPHWPRPLENDSIPPPLSLMDDLIPAGPRDRLSEQLEH